PIDEANGPIAMQLQCVCHDTLPWLISVSLDDSATSTDDLRAQLDRGSEHTRFYRIRWSELSFLVQRFHTLGVGVLRRFRCGWSRRLSAVACRHCPCVLSSGHALRCCRLL